MNEPFFNNNYCSLHTLCITILNNIREAQKKDATTVDEDSVAVKVDHSLKEAMDFDGSSQEK